MEPNETKATEVEAKETKTESFLKKVFASQYFKIGLVVVAALFFYRFMGFFIFVFFVAAVVLCVQFYVLTRGGWKKFFSELKAEFDD